MKDRKAIYEIGRKESVESQNDINKAIPNSIIKAFKIQLYLAYYSLPSRSIFVYIYTI